MKHLLLLFWLACAAIQLGAASRADGHGFAGPRFFPATLTTEDPFVADELSLPTISTIRTPEDGGTRETELSADIAKRITPNFALDIGETFTASESALKERRLMVSAIWSWAGNIRSWRVTRTKRSSRSDSRRKLAALARAAVGADSFSTWAPGILFGKGFGDLPEGLRFLRPFALTGAGWSRVSDERKLAEHDDRRSRPVQEKSRSSGIRTYWNGVLRWNTASRTSNRRCRTCTGTRHSIG